MDYKKICFETGLIAREAGKYIFEEKEKMKSEDIQVKGLHDFVTYVDNNSEQLIIERLSKLLPGSVFLSEEGFSTEKSSELMWVIDPLDGTTNYIHGVPLFTVSIALLHNMDIVTGVIYEPNFNECYYAWHKGGAWLNNKRISVSETSLLVNSLLATGFPFHDYKYLDVYLNFLKFTIEETRGLRRLGSAALDLAWVACGRFDGFYEYSLNAWDVAAGACIVSEAGGIVTDFSNKNNFLFGKEIIAANKNIHEQLCQKIQVFFFDI